MHYLELVMISQSVLSLREKIHESAQFFFFYITMLSSFQTIPILLYSRAPGLLLPLERSLTCIMYWNLYLWPNDIVTLLQAMGSDGGPLAA